MTKTVVMLIGPKGAGKTHMGAVLGRRTDIEFLRVEPIWLSLADGQDGWTVVEDAIDDLFQKTNCVVIESLGGSPGFEQLRGNLEQKYAVHYVRIAVPLEVCLEHVRTRDSNNHIPVSDDQVEAYNKLAAEVVLPWDLELVNEPPLTDQSILDSFESILKVVDP